MIPAQDAQQDGQPNGQNGSESDERGDARGDALGMGDATPTPVLLDTRWFAPVDQPEPSEAVVLMPPESVTRGVLVERDGQTSVEAGADLERRSPSRRGTPAWAIAAALIVGATATLSAQAVMRRPARRALDATVVASNAVRPAESSAALPAQAETGAALAPSSALVGLAAPTVVPSTATFPAESEPADARTILKLVVTNEHTRPVRALVRAGVRPSGEPRAIASKTSRPTMAATAWVDPFVVDEESPSVGHSAARGKTSAATTASRHGTVSAQKVAGNHTGARAADIAWDDPFVR